MTTISAEVVCDSIEPRSRSRLTTLLLRYPRFIHAEFMTHRVFSRNASSSRAIPVQRLIDDIIRDPAIPMFWGKNQPGMQAGEECDEPVVIGDKYERESLDRGRAWERALDSALVYARAFSDAGYHKQVVNRLLEPFGHINVVVSATEWDNFFALRRHPAAEPHIRLLADRIHEAMAASAPKELDEYEWHLPFITDDDWEPALEFCDERNLHLFQVIPGISAARCARTSYRTHDGAVPSVEADIALFARLGSETPMHASPMEHQAYVLAGKWPGLGFESNFSPCWLQFRRALELGIVEKI